MSVWRHSEPKSKKGRYVPVRLSMRTKGSGQRWHGKGVDAVLTLRAYEMSGRLPAFFRCLAETYTAATVKPGYWASAA